MEGLLPEVSYKRNGLYNKNLSPNWFSTKGGKYLLLHKSTAEEWSSFAFRITITGDSFNDTCFVIDGNTQSFKSDGSCIVWSIYMHKELFKVLWKKNEDNSIEVYLTVKSETFGNRYILKEAVCYTNTNIPMQNIDSINEDDFRVCEIIGS